MFNKLTKICCRKAFYCTFIYFFQYSTNFYNNKYYSKSTKKNLSTRKKNSIMSTKSDDLESEANLNSK